MADTMDEQSWSTIKEDLTTFLNGFKPLYKKQVSAVEEARDRLNERQLTKEMLDKAYTEIKKEIKSTLAKKLYESIDKYLTLTQSDTIPPEEKEQGEKKMSEDSKNPTTETPAEEETKKFTPKGVWLKAGYMAGITDKEFETEDAFKAAVRDAGYIVDGEKILLAETQENGQVYAPAAMEERKETKEAVEEAFADKETLSEEDDKTLKDKLEKISQKYAVNVNEDTNESSANQDWIERKRKIYQEMTANNTIKGYQEVEVPNGFGASIEGGQITYTAENNVTVSKESKIAAFEAILSERDNIGRSINFADNMSTEMKVRLFAACTLHNNKMLGALPSAEEIMQHADLLKTELGEERFAEFQQKIQASSSREESRPNEEQHETAQELSEAAQKIKDIKNQFQQMKDNGKIVIKYDDDAKRNVIVAGEAITDETEKASVVAEATNLIKAASELVKSVEEENAKAEAIKERLEFAKSRLTEDQKAKIGDKPEKTTEQIKENLQAREKRDHENSVKLGIIEPTEEDKNVGLQPLSGEELNKYIADSGINKPTFARLAAKAEGKPMYDTSGKLNFDESKLTAPQKETFSKLSGTVSTQQPTRDTSHSH